MNTMSKVCVSIIVPVYNTEKYLSTCLDSLMNQTLLEIEVICVNDGSNDGSPVILREYAKKDARIKVIDKTNEGQGVARNLAISVATGKYVAFVDSDDCVDHDLCRRAYECAEESHADVLMYDYTKISEDLGIRNRGSISSLASVSDSDRQTLLAHMGVVWTKLVRLEWLRTHGIHFPENRIYEDIFVHWQLLTLADRLVILPERLYYHRINSAATTFRTDWKRADAIAIYDMVRDFLVARNLYQQYRNIFLLRQLSHFSSIYDAIDGQFKPRVMAMIRDRIGEDECRYIREKHCLRWQDRDFYLALTGSIPAKLRRAIWLLARACYRNLKKQMISDTENGTDSTDAANPQEPIL